MIDDEIKERAYAGKATKKDAFEILELNPFEIFNFADELRKKEVGDTVTYVINRNIYLTNMCTAKCKFCSFNQDKGYLMNIPNILKQIEESQDLGVIEVCIQGGFLPDIDLEYYIDIVGSVKERFPEITIHAFSPMEIYNAARISGLSLNEAFQKLKDAGLDTLTGTSAEVLSDRVRKIICPSKITTEQWIETIMKAHETGLSTNSTIMYGHVETWEERIDHILIIRDIQQKTGRFTEFVPLPFLPYNNRIGEEMMDKGKYATGGIEDLKLYAISRILLHTHIPNIQASWVKLGKKLAQVALNCGANDLGGTLIEDQITMASGGTNGQWLPPEEIEWLINQIGRTPTKRDTLYREFK
ncbi:7,8-didemethyl-8-hydroxy-5-deazariboflavin synthase subunit CofH [Methanohalophilus sp.]|uniref:7,8-didemethyl-8-hydroxy-5-deazariboflavin synthase subunit CofH n=1 Tax=Methanohalophilus sp. TaxID=1966352 RepID=UPI0026380A63|nr:7,8-didemethyl-8-hydroxy-5-deazariboflavin synthase subunit CofH [Methanohalophilus sp.]MDK2892621.1 5-amino-6-(D-ribitylamino)uracil---L-tyrosine 4-hydroxyphenyl transferase [Methanohalophilus sp.]